MTETAPKPIPCRHCGNGMPLVNSIGVEKWVECDICGCRGPKSSFVEYAVNDWNSLCRPNPETQAVDRSPMESVPEVTHYQGARVKCAPTMRPIIDLESRDNQFDYFLVRAEVKIAAPVESVPVSALEKLISDWRHSRVHLTEDDCADRLSAIVEEQK